MPAKGEIDTDREIIARDERADADAHGRAKARGEPGGSTPQHGAL